MWFLFSCWLPTRLYTVMRSGTDIAIHMTSFMQCAQEHLRGKQPLFVPETIHMLQILLYSQSTMGSSSTTVLFSVHIFPYKMLIFHKNHYRFFSLHLNYLASAFHCRTSPWNVQIDQMCLSKIETDWQMPLHSELGDANSSCPPWWKCRVGSFWKRKPLIDRNTYTAHTWRSCFSLS